ncbi:MAG: O-antigen ligase domain-containing protein [Desulfobacteraceae bacterium]|nr:MAG: O-antigen ligase domain-containing protein [Desulfobacteraceae bacterium]
MALFLLNLYLLIYFIRPAEWIPALQSPWQLYVGILSLLLIVGTFIKKPDLFKKDKFGIYIFIFFLICLVSKIATGWFGGTWIFFQEFLPSIVVYYLTVIACDSLKKCQSLLFFLCMLACFFSVHAIMQITTGSGFGGLLPIYRSGDLLQACWYGVFNDPNDLGLALVVIMPYIVYQALRYRILYILFFALILGGIYCTNSRGTLVSLLAGLGMFFIFKKKSMKGLIIAGFMAVALFLFGPSRVSEINTVDASSYGRIDAWYAGLKMMQSSPLIGVGPGAFTDHHPITAHNSYVLAAAETGFLGLMFYNGAILIPILLGARVLFQEKENENFELMASILSCAIAGAVSICFISRTYIMVPYMMSGILYSVFHSVAPDRLTNEMQTRLSIKHLFLVSFLMLFLFYLAIVFFL